jgi:glycosyltransferase involved in cell wall biosynthesis
VLGSVVIPAHNEATVIDRCLNALLEGFRPGEVDVVVACNGCSDATAKIAASHAYPVRVLEIAAASKTAALRAADEVLDSFPRLYLDADVVLSSEAARTVLSCLHEGAALAARPPIEYNFASSAPLVKSYYRARTRVPAVMGSLWGAGVYGLSNAGRSRFGSYPDVVADDLMVDQHFDRQEIAIVDSQPVIVNVPRKTGDLLRILRRTYAGNLQNKDMPRPSTASATTPSTLRDLGQLARSGPRAFIDASVYMGMACAARLSVAVAPPTKWQRDNSSRRESPW